MVSKFPLAAATLVVASGFALACASAPKPASDDGAGLRYDAECALARARARVPEAPPELIAPRPVGLFIPPLPVPDRVKGDTAWVAVRVDSAGSPVAESIEITGVTDSRYVARMRTMIARTRFRPAALEGCAVEGTARITYILEKRRAGAG